MATVREFLLPDVGEGLTEAEVVRWHVAVGDHVEVNQPLAEIETAKALVELPCPYAGEVQELLVPLGRVVPVGTPLVAFAVTAVDAPEPFLVGYGVGSEPTGRRRRTHVASPSVPTPTVLTPAAPTLASSGRVMAKPPVRLLARRLGLDLHHIAGSGPGGIVTRDDVQRAVTGAGRVAHEPVRDLPGDRRVAASAVQRAMAEAMVKSAAIPQALVWSDVDMTCALAHMQTLRGLPEFDGARVTPLTMVCGALLRSMAEHPGIAVVWDAGSAEVVHRADVRVGVAVDSARGLLVPHVDAADRLSLAELAHALTEVTTAAREGRATPEQLQAGVITVTNVGVFGVDGGTPLLYPGETAIVGMGQVRERAWVHDGAVVPRPVVSLSLAFDHRVVDGALASRVLASVVHFLESAGDW